MFCVHTTLFSADPLKFDIRPRVFIIPRQLSAIIRQGCFYRNSAKTRGAYVSKSVWLCAGIHSKLTRFRGTVRKEKKRKRKENTASVRCTYSRVIDYAMSRDIFYLTVNYTDEFSNNKRVLLLTKKLETGIFRAGLMDRCKYNSPVRTSYSERRLMW